MISSLTAVLLGTFTLRFSTGLTGLLLVYFFDDLSKTGQLNVQAILIGVFSAIFFASELVLATPFGLLSDRWGHHRVMQFGPVFGAVAVTATFFAGGLFAFGLTVLGFTVIALTRLLEGASTAASVPSILGFIAHVTAGDELARGRASARFEGATLSGLGVGLVAAGPLFTVFGRTAFLLNALVYITSLLIYRFGVHEAPGEEEERLAPHRTWRRYLELLTSSHVWLLAPTWISINAALGMWTSQSVFQLIRPNGRFPEQKLMGGFDPNQVSLGLAAGLLVFFAGLVFWGDRFRRFRRTTIIFYGICGGAAIVVAAGLLNHSEGQPAVLRIVYGAVVVAGVFVLAGATPAALGLLADMSEAYAADRGAIMGLYSVFLAFGQIIGSLIGGAAAQLLGIDGLLIGTLILLLIALVPLSRLRSVEHVVGTSAPSRRQVEPT